jgi:hypothetical protein
MGGMGSGSAGTAAGGSAIAGARPAGGASRGGVAQPANRITPAANQHWRARMEWILLEAAVALGLAIFFAWWLVRGKLDSPRDRKRDP